MGQPARSLFAGVSLCAGCKRDGQRVALVHAGNPAPIHGAEDVSAVATAVFSLTCKERSNPFQSNAFFNFQDGRMAIGAHCNSSVIGRSLPVEVIVGKQGTDLNSRENIA
jgi:hypothetical protein